MNIIRYKPWFSLTAQYEIKNIGIRNESIYTHINPGAETILQGFRLRSRTQGHVTTVYFSGKEMPETLPIECVPFSTLPDHTFLYFNLQFSDKKFISQLKFFPSDTDAKRVGFPILYEAQLDEGGNPDITARADVRIQAAGIFTYRVTQAATGLTTAQAPLQVTMENHPEINPSVETALLNEKIIDGADAIPEYAFSIDTQKWPTGVYQFKVGNVEENIFIASGLNTEAVAIIRVNKNADLNFKTALNDNNIVHFNLIIPQRE